MAVPQRHSDANHDRERGTGTEVFDGADRVKSQKKRSYEPEKMQRWYADDEPGRSQEMRAADSGQGEDRRSRLERGLRALSRNDERVNCSLERVRDAEYHADQHDEGRGNNHSCDQRCSTPVWRQFVFKKLF